MHERAPTLMLDGRASYAYVERTTLSVVNVSRWSVAEVERYIRESIRLGTKSGTAASVSHFLGEIPGAAERKRITEIMKEEGVQTSLRTVLLADSALLRGVATAWAWLTNAEARAVAPEARRAGIEWAVAGTDANVDRIEHTLIECYRLLGVEPPRGAR